MLQKEHEIVTQSFGFYPKESLKTTSRVKSNISLSLADSKTHLPKNPCRVWSLQTQNVAPSIGVNWHSYVDGNPVNNTDPTGYYEFVNGEVRDHIELRPYNEPLLTSNYLNYDTVNRKIAGFQEAQRNLQNALNSIVPTYEDVLGCKNNSKMYKAKLKLLKNFKNLIDEKESVLVTINKEGLNGGHTDIFGNITLYEYHKKSAEKLITHESAHKLGFLLNFFGYNIRNEAPGEGEINSEVYQYSDIQTELRNDTRFPGRAYEFEAWIKGLIDKQPNRIKIQFKHTADYWGY